MAETLAAFERRYREKFFEKYCQGHGIDIGCGDDPITSFADKWDLRIDPAHDALTMDGVPNGHYDFVYSSHCLEHISNPMKALSNWWRILKPGGYLILLLPHRDLYEKKKELPSDYNSDHKWFFLPSRGEEPITLSLINLLNLACVLYDLIYLKLCESYSFECVIRKPGGDYAGGK
jgi:SAM-dependent methyltransferase